MCGAHLRPRPATATAGRRPDLRYRTPDVLGWPAVAPLAGPAREPAQDPGYRGDPAPVGGSPAAAPRPWPWWRLRTHFTSRGGSAVSSGYGPGVASACCVSMNGQAADLWPADGIAPPEIRPRRGLFASTEPSARRVSVFPDPSTLAGAICATACAPGDPRTAHPARGVSARRERAPGGGSQPARRQRDRDGRRRLSAPRAAVPGADPIHRRAQSRGGAVWPAWEPATRRSWNARSPGSCWRRRGRDAATVAQLRVDAAIPLSVDRGLRRSAPLCRGHRPREVAVPTPVTASSAAPCASGASTPTRWGRRSRSAYFDRADSVGLP